MKAGCDKRVIAKISNAYYVVIANERSEVWQSTKKAMDCHEFARLRFANSRNDEIGGSQ